jgi:hypothetical protein
MVANRTVSKQVDLMNSNKIFRWSNKNVSVQSDARIAILAGNKTGKA